MASWNHTIEKNESPSYHSCAATVKSKADSPFANAQGRERCPAGKREYRATFRYVTGKGGRVTTRELYFCAEHAKAWAAKHGLVLPPAPCGVKDCCLDDQHEGEHLYKCCGAHCPGLPYKASRQKHPETCVLGQGTPEAVEKTKQLLAELGGVQTIQLERDGKPCPACAEHYGDDGVCDEGKPGCSPHRKEERP